MVYLLDSMKDTGSTEEFSKQKWHIYAQRIIHILMETENMVDILRRDANLLTKLVDLTIELSIFVEFIPAIQVKNVHCFICNILNISIYWQVTHMY